MTSERKATADELAGIEWWNAMDDAARAFWLRKAGPSVATAWAHRQRLAGATVRDVAEASTGSFVGRLVVLTAAARDGDASAKSEVQRAGELLEFAGGAAALLEVQDLVRAYQCNHPEHGRAHDIGASLMAYWEHVTSSPQQAMRT